jgi:hypothetical protein
LYDLADFWQFLGLSFVPAIASGFVMPSQIIAQIGMSLDGLQDIAWIPGGWSIGAAVSFAIAGALSDIFGRRWVVMFGQSLVLVGSVSLRYRSNCESTTDRMPDCLCYSRDCPYRRCRQFHDRLWCWLYPGLICRYCRVASEQVPV